MTEVLALAIPSFLAGVLTFLAPCTLPLVPAYLGLISGVPYETFHDPSQVSRIRGQVLRNGLMFVLGFAAIFILFGVLAGLAGAVFASLRSLMAQVGGVLVIVLGLFMLGLLKLPVLQRTVRFTPPQWLQPGRAHSSFVIGVAFAAGWSPCVGPIVGSILALTASSATVAQGALLLGIFSLGLAVPFLLLAYGIGRARATFERVRTLTPIFEKVGGVVLIGLGILLLTNRLPLLISWSFQLLNVFGYESILEYL